jgi:hypothetical protein
MMFKIHLHPDLRLIRDRASRGRPITFPIHISVGESVFPDAQWHDFPVVILGWWLEQVNALSQDPLTTAILRFMDGPYEIKISPKSADLWLLTGLVRESRTKAAFREVCSAAQVFNEVRRASTDLLQFLKAADFWDDECAKLELLVSADKSSEGGV